jgi:2-polyprenyl-3-methyl-5-hydroxy-6-metoxy-1,4-benzoquinol methylase
MSCLLYSSYSDLLKERDSAFYLRILISHFLRITVPEARIIVESLKNATDEEFVTNLKNHHANYERKEKSLKWLYNHQKANLNAVLSHLELSSANNITTFLDFGCDDGVKTEIIGEILNINTNNIYGLDITNNTNKHTNNNFYQYDGVNIPDIILSQSYDLITCSQVLHHINHDNIKLILEKLISRITPNGYFLLKEHDFNCQWMKILIELQHVLFTIDKEIEFPILTYNSEKEWINMFENLGMKLINTHTENPTCKMHFYALFQKV